MPIRKVMTLRLEFNLSEKINHGAAVKAANDAAIAGAVEAVRQEMPENSIASVTSHMTYDYRWIEYTGSEINENLDWDDASVVEQVETGML